MGRLGNIRVISGGLGCEESEVTFCKTEELPEFPIAETVGRRNAQLMNVKIRECNRCILKV